jgi:signal-transduction protein with cAMP-binding, CBS, and nucleotidyltransferase domain
MATRIRVAMDWGLDLLISRSIAEIRATQAASRYIRFLAGDLVIEPGVDPGGLYVVISGAFDSQMPGTDQSRTLGPNSCFGMAVGGEAGSDQERITARKDSTVYFVEKSDLKRLAMVSALIKQGAGIKASAESDAESKPGRDGPS